MKTRTIVFALVTVLLANVKDIRAQEMHRSSSTLHPCPGGTGTATGHPASVPTSLDDLVRMSQLIVVGTVAKVFPAFNTNPDHLISIATPSMVELEDLLYGTLPSGTRTIVLTQMGGKAGPCALVVPDDPLVQSGEQYVFFLIADDRPEIPNASGSLRYVDLWGGKAKVVKGKVQFLPAASPGLHEYDNTDVTAFIAAVEDRIKILRQRK